MSRPRVALLLAAAIVAGACVAPPAACGALHGGEPGAAAQLRWVRFGDDQISLLFGLRTGEAFGVPEHTAEGAAPTVRLRIPNARLRYPDGSPSYLGDLALRPPAGRIATISIAEDAEGVLLTLQADGGGCPRLASRRYGLGSTHSAALISVALRDGPAVALDPAHGATGFPLQVIGLGFAPSSRVTFGVEGRDVWESTTDGAGRLDTVLYVPALSPGEHSVVVRDGRGSATTWFRVDDR